MIVFYYDKVYKYFLCYGDNNNAFNNKQITLENSNCDRNNYTSYRSYSCVDNILIYYTNGIYRKLVFLSAIIV